MIHNDGKAAEAEFEARFNAQPRTIVYRIPDLRDLVGLNGGKRLTDYAKPSDYIVSQEDRTWFAEVKSTHNVTRLSYACLQKGQRAMCLKQAKIGGKWDLHVFGYVPGQWFIVDCQRIAADIKAGVASIAFKDMQAWH